MKKLIASLGFLTVFLSGCSPETGSTGSMSKSGTVSSQSQANQSQTEQSQSESSSVVAEDEPSSAVIYFSRSGDTKEIAETIQQQTNSDIFAIQVVEEYPADYSELLSYVKERITQGQLPAIVSPEIHLSDYHRIYLGSPIWFNDLSQPVLAWLQEVDLSGLEIVPFFTSGSSSYVNAQVSLNALLPDATILEGIGITDVNRNNYESLVTVWLDALA